jgi:enoyl-CoA hydratase/carnithine racemase
MSDALITTNVDDGIATLTLNRPDTRNAMTAEMGRCVEAAVDALNARNDVRVVVVTGAGRAFSSGGDLDSLAKEAGLSDAGDGLNGGANFYRLFLSVDRLRVPSIAALNGHAIGAGLCFALACDLRVMHEHAKVGMTFVKIGIHPGMAASWNLPRLIGSSNAADLLFTGRLVDAKEALSMGLVNRVAGEADFATTVSEVARSIAANGPLAVRALKETLRGTFTRTIDEAVVREADAQARTFKSADAREGISAIKEKRSPRFKGI